MIENEKQYRIAKAQERRFEAAIGELAHQKRPAPSLGNLSPSGLYTAPEDVSRPQLISVTATSTARKRA